jgi:predicted metal-dependent hydrolase
MSDKSQAANTLAVIKSKMNKLIDYLQMNIKEFPAYTKNITDLVKRTRKIYIMETPKDEKFTSYTINKGEKIVFCLRSKILHTIHDLNTILYVCIHELAHCATESFGHTPEFKENFKFLLIQANKIGIYKITNYRLNPTDYCGMTINEYLLDNVKIE